LQHEQRRPRRRKAGLRQIVIEGQRIYDLQPAASIDADGGADGFQARLTADDVHVDAFCGCACQ